MTLRSIALGSLVVAILAALTYYSDIVLVQTRLIGNHFPVSIFGLILLIAGVVNPLLRWAGVRLALTRREVAVVLIMSLGAAVVPGAGLMRYLNPVLMLPHQHEKSEAGWREYDPLSELPSYVLADPQVEEGEALDAFVQGMGDIGWGDIPWSAWSAPYAFWGPLLLALWGGMLGLAIVLHRQWSRHEHLPYPIAQIGVAFFPEQEGRRASSILKQKSFYVGMIPVALVHLLNYWGEWDPGVITVPLEFDFKPLVELLPEVYHGASGFSALDFHVYFTVIGIAFFIPRDVSFSVGIAPLAFAVAEGFFLSRGVSLSGGGELAPENFFVFGGFVGLFVMIVATGRFFFAEALRGAVALGGSDGASAEVVWGARLALAGFLGFIVGQVLMGIPLLFAVLTLVIVAIVFVVMSRLIAETGIYFFTQSLVPAALLLGFLGDRAVGPTAALLVGLVGVLVVADPREAFMPYLMNAFRVGDHAKVRTKGAAWLVAAGLLLALLIAAPTTLFIQYSRGSGGISGGVFEDDSKTAIEMSVGVSQRLEAKQLLEATKESTMVQNLFHASPDGRLAASFAVGAGLAALFAFLRLRVTWWPLHPAIFVLAVGSGSELVAVSFLIGCFIKFFVAKYLGHVGTERLKPFMLGLIAGDLAAGLISMGAGLAIYFTTSQIPPTYNVTPY